MSCVIGKMLLYWNNIFHVCRYLVVTTALAALAALAALVTLAALAALACVALACVALACVALACVALACVALACVAAARQSVLATVSASIFPANNATSFDFTALASVFSNTKTLSHGVYIISKENKLSRDQLFFKIREGQCAICFVMCNIFFWRWS